MLKSVQPCFKCLHLLLLVCICIAVTVQTCFDCRIKRPLKEPVDSTVADPRHLLLTLDDIPPANPAVPLTSLLQSIDGLCPSNPNSQGNLISICVTNYWTVIATVFFFLVINCASFYSLKSMLSKWIFFGLPLCVVQISVSKYSTTLVDFQIRD